MATEYSDELLEEMGELQEQIDHPDGWDLDSQLEQAMDALRCPPADADVSVLSGGERRRVALCRLLLEQPDLLLLDEPTNHLDAESVQWLEQHLAEYPGTVVAVTHDRYFLDNVAEWILELDRGRAYPYEGNYSTYLETKAARLKVEGAKDAKQAQAARGRAGVGPVEPAGPAGQEQGPAPALRGDGRRGRHARASSTSTRSRSRPARGWAPRWSRPSELAKGFGDRVLIEDLSFSLPRGGIVGVIGPNGVGKTTLFKMIIGDEKPDAGTIRVGETVEISYVDQGRAGIDPDKNAVGGGLRRGRLHPGRPGRDPQPRLRRGVRVQGPRPAEAGRACSPAASATG